MEATIEANTMNTPPVVGVPSFAKCDFGPTSLIYCPYILSFKNFIYTTPNKSDKTMAVKQAIILNIIYFATPSVNFSNSMLLEALINTFPSFILSKI